LSASPPAATWSRAASLVSRADRLTVAWSAGKIIDPFSASFAPAHANGRIARAFRFRRRMGPSTEDELSTGSVVEKNLMRKILFGAAFSSALIAAPALAQEGRFYVGGELGALVSSA